MPTKTANNINLELDRIDKRLARIENAIERVSQKLKAIRRNENDRRQRN